MLASSELCAAGGAEMQGQGLPLRAAAPFSHSQADTLQVILCSLLLSSFTIIKSPLMLIR